MIIKKSLLKTFLLYGIGLLGGLYFTLSYFVWHAFFWHRNEWGVGLGHLGVISVVSFLLCLLAVGLVIAKLWSAYLDKKISPKDVALIVSSAPKKGLSVSIFIFLINSFLTNLDPLDMSL